ncbi:MAG TPA: phosphoribosyltransferase domain-containing protein [Nocardioides sp.]|nr:phosphoribosyltransferase domain-containing protein [Nocardioides sp.]
MTTAANTAVVGPAIDVPALLGLAVPADATFAELAGFALRRNPRRAHLIVSRVLGKHVPAAPSAVLGAARRLADAVRAVEPAAAGPDALVLGYCETATGLGHAVAEHLGAPYLHSTREPVAGLPIAVSFEEEHSHAVAHHLQPGVSVELRGAGPLVLVDDELTTGRTVLNTIDALHARFPRRSYVIATLVDARTAEQQETFRKAVADLGLDVRVAALSRVAIGVPADVLERAAEALEALAPPPPTVAETGGRGEVRVHPAAWPDGLPTGGRNGVTHEQTLALVEQARILAEGLAPHIGGSVLVVGVEELMYLPTLLAAALAERPGLEVRVQSTTRSPVHAADQPGYAVRRSLVFDAPNQPGRESRLHNLVDPWLATAGVPWAERRCDHVVVVTEAAAEACSSLTEALRPYADIVHLLPLRAGR